MRAVEFGLFEEFAEEVTESYLCFRGISLWHHGEWLGRGKMGAKRLMPALRRVNQGCRSVNENKERETVRITGAGFERGESIFIPGVWCGPW